MGFLTIEEFMADLEKPFTLREIVYWRVVSILRIPKDIYWWFQHRFNPKHQYNKIHTGLKPGYWDPDISLLCGIFETTTRFVAETKDLVDWEDDSSHQKAWKAYTEAVTWWEENRQKFLDCNFETWEEKEDARKSAEYYASEIILNSRYICYP